jgi:outer membrane protein assembly factor BamA
MKHFFIYRKSPEKQNLSRAFRCFCYSFSIMNRKLLLFLTAGVLLCAIQPASAQKFRPKTIQFKGAPEYSDQELLAAAWLNKGAVLNYDEMKGHSQKLMDTGVFETLSFKFDGVDLVYTLVPATDLYPILLDNLPLAPGKELEAALHVRFPLFHGKVPSDGGIMEGVRQALEEMLAAEGIKATVAAAPYTDQKLRKVTAISYVITAPPVQVGEIRLQGAPKPLDAGAAEVLTKLTGSAYDTEGSPNQIETNLGNYYRDKGYLEAEIHAAPQNAPVVTPDAVRIPFLVSVSTGAQYKLAGIHLAPDLLVTQAEFDRQSHIHPGDIATSQYVRENLLFIERQYHNKGFMKAVVHPAASFDRAQGTASFTVTAEPGPVYTMGTLTIQNVSDDLRAAMLAAWPMPAGAVFNQGAILSYYAIRDANPVLGRIFAAVNCKFVLTLNDDSRTVDVVLRLEKRR